MLAEVCYAEVFVVLTVGAGCQGFAGQAILAMALLRRGVRVDMCLRRQMGLCRARAVALRA